MVTDASVGLTQSNSALQLNDRSGEGLVGAIQNVKDYLRGVRSESRSYQITNHDITWHVSPFSIRFLLLSSVTRC